MMQKLNLNYQIEISFNNTNVVLQISYPQTLKLNVHRSATLKLNTGTFEIYNLKESTKNLLFHDRFNRTFDKKFILKAGYGNNLTTVFIGNIIEAYSEKIQTNIITKLIVQDGVMSVNSAISNISLNNVSGLDIFKQLSHNLGLQIGTTGNIIETFANGASFGGNTYKNMQEVFDNKVFIDNEKINYLNDDEFINQTLDINSSNGLLSTPKRQGQYVIIETLFEPEIKAGCKVNFTSTVNPYFNGTYKAIGIYHFGTISGSEVGAVTTKLELRKPIIVNQT